MAAAKLSRESVKVIVRCRPLSTKELSTGYLPVVDVDRPSRRVRVKSEREESGEKEFTFDAVFGSESTQEDVFHESVRPLVDAVLQGFNGTIFAYGQTGTGKTFTMQGSPGAPGIIPRAMGYIFKHIEDSTNEHFLVNASYLEIYQEDLRDLLRKKEKDDPETKIEIKEKPNGQIYIKHLSQYQLKNIHHMEKMMERGQNNRSVGATDMNEYSSRSHAIFIVNIECGQLGIDGKEHIRVGKLNLVDLAGSEKQSKANSSGERFREATHINLSLSSLGKVITSLVEKAPHIPYRDSKLTRMLQDSLGGNSKTIMVANVGPACYNLDETLSTLRYANRAKNIKNSPQINEDPKDAKLREYLDELTALKAKLANRSPTETAPKRPKSRKHADVEENGEDSDSSQRYALEHKKIAEERNSTLDNNGLNEKEKDNLLQEFALKEEDLKRREAERHELKAKVEAIEQRMLHGSSANVHERMTAQKENLQRTQQQLDEQKRQEELILEALDREQRDALEAKDTVSVVKSDIDNMTSKIAKLKAQVDLVQLDLNKEEAVTQQFNESYGDQMETLRQRESLLWTMVSHFIGPAAWEPLLQNAEFNKKTGDWILPSESSEITRPPLFISVSGNRECYIKEAFSALMIENTVELTLDSENEEDADETLENMDAEGTACAQMLAEALDVACLEDDMFIDADIFTIELPRSRTATPDLEKENWRRGSISSKALRTSPDLRMPDPAFPSSRGWMK